MLNLDLKALTSDLRIEEISSASLPYRRPREAGKNARLDVHGWGGDLPIVRIKAGGIEAFGWSPLSHSQAELLTGFPIRAFFHDDIMLKSEYKGIEFPLLDWLGRYFHKPVYELAARTPEKLSKDFSIPVYDTTIYFDELHIKDDNEAVKYLLDEVSQGLGRGHKHFKIKIGRCGMWMPLLEGLKRDIAIVNGIRDFVGPEAKLMVDANNAFNLNITKEFLKATKDAKVYWLEEAFHEDNMLYAKLKEWMKEQGIATLIADGEGQASPSIVDWVKQCLIDVFQYNVRFHGFFYMMQLYRDLEPFKVLYAPHNYGGFYGNYATAHIASCTEKFIFGEFDVADAEGIDTSAYKIKEGRLEVPRLDGFGLSLDNTVFEKYREQKGYRIRML